MRLSHVLFFPICRHAVLLVIGFWDGGLLTNIPKTNNVNMLPILVVSFFILNLLLIAWSLSFTNTLPILLYFFDKIFLDSCYPAPSLSIYLNMWYALILCFFSLKFCKHVVFVIVDCVFIVIFYFLDLCYLQALRFVFLWLILRRTCYSTSLKDKHQWVIWFSNFFLWVSIALALVLFVVI